MERADASASVANREDLDIDNAEGLFMMMVTPQFLFGADIFRLRAGPECPFDLWICTERAKVGEEILCCSIYIRLC
jgi:hypothetical protein